ncbi:hypothetical protein [Pseudodesulfovibrio piezophilus]|uniref:Uncharacterized protein n=1 Tax=Pseudodesulfovibrio piezophilus (strain DSM 21447 / JCM 15486 / C1TLV30) TaxID=1322246 RepID=M1WWW5_PSEP2|nr:hypothetical protein [Pseudodesulfovibrio piezophilus]CCH49358.1 conserved protein of unknown function [Pseudodesulfovibrio piezophilus C1TLV30]
MSMDCDTRLSMMALREHAQQNRVPRRISSTRRMSMAATATTVAALASLALTLFTRSA